MRAPEARAKIFGIFCRRAVFLCIWKQRLPKMWNFLLGWGVLEHPQHPPRYGPDIHLLSRTRSVLTGCFRKSQGWSKLPCCTFGLHNTILYSSLFFHTNFATQLSLHVLIMSLQIQCLLSILPIFILKGVAPKSCFYSDCWKSQKILS